MSNAPMAAGGGGQGVVQRVVVALRSGVDQHVCAEFPGGAGGDLVGCDDGDRMHGGHRRLRR